MVNVATPANALYRVFANRELLGTFQRMAGTEFLAPNGIRKSCADPLHVTLEEGCVSPQAAQNLQAARVVPQLRILEVSLQGSTIRGWDVRAKQTVPSGTRPGSIGNYAVDRLVLHLESTRRIK